ISEGAIPVAGLLILRAALTSRWFLIRPVQNYLKSRGPPTLTSRNKVRNVGEPMSRECPLCRLTNPDSALRCDCGYDFGTGVIKASYLQTAQNPKAAAKFQELVEKHGSVNA